MKGGFWDAIRPQENPNTREIEYDYQNIQVKFYKNEVTSKWKQGVGK